VGADELVEVLVAGDDDRLQALLLGLLGQGADDVVGLPVLLLEHRDVERLDQGAAPGDRRLHLLGHLPAGGLVLRMHLLPEAVAGVEDHAQVVRIVLLQEVDQEPGEPEGGRGVLAAGGGQRPADHGVERPVHEGVAVHQEEGGPVELGIWELVAQGVRGRLEAWLAGELRCRERRRDGPSGPSHPCRSRAGRADAGGQNSYTTRAMANRPSSGAPGKLR